jgi:ADP-ribosylglycohydrolase
MTQWSLFDELPKQPLKRNGIPSLDRFQGAMLCSTVGDALGWPTEFLHPNGNHNPPFELPVHEFVQWKKLVGGKWWGYEQKIAPGEYSDDTQLMLAIARSITEEGRFEPERFAYEELPLWLQYERGGGKSVKTAARKLIGKNADWLRNFYKQGELAYTSAGANGAAMRNLPIALVNVGNESRIIKDSFFNAIITHGHPRAILGAVLFGLAVNYTLTITPSGNVSTKALIEYLHTWMDQIGRAITDNDLITTWIRRWDKNSEESSFRLSFDRVHQETSHYLEGIQKFIHADAKTYYTFVGALNPATRGSGLATVCAAIYMFLKYVERPSEALVIAANMFGSDTDTIGVFLGALLGAYHGTNAVQSQLLDQVQDRDYLLKTAKRLHTIASGEQQENLIENQVIERRDAYFRILAWEIGLHDMFWDTIEVGEVVVHPTLGRGTIIDKDVKPIKREGYVAKLIHINFDCGQSCIFHSRVENNDKVSESLAQDIVNALKE